MNFLQFISLISVSVLVVFYTNTSDIKNVFAQPTLPNSSLIIDPQEAIPFFKSLETEGFFPNGTTDKLLEASTGNNQSIIDLCSDLSSKFKEVNRECLLFEQPQTPVNGTIEFKIDVVGMLIEKAITHKIENAIACGKALSTASDSLDKAEESGSDADKQQAGRDVLNAIIVCHRQ